MRILERLFGGQKARSVALLEGAIGRLRVGLFATLDKSHRAAYADERFRTFLCAAILNHVVVEPPGNNEAVKFAETHWALIEAEARKIGDDPEISRIASYLYAAQILHAAISTRDPFSERAQVLGERATDLGIYIPNTYDICGQGDGASCTIAIAEYANEVTDALRT
jgi:hypothetical protein